MYLWDMHFVGSYSSERFDWAGPVLFRAQLNSGVLNSQPLGFEPSYELV